MVAREDLVKLATRVVTKGELARLRRRFGMSRTTMAGLMGVSPESLKNWESGEQGMKTTTAIRIAHWWQQATKAEKAFKERGGRVTDLMPITSYVSPLGVSQQTVMSWCESRDIEFEDLDVLGVFIYRHEMSHAGRGHS